MEAYLLGREALVDDLQVIRKRNEGRLSNKTYRRMEGDRQTQAGERHSPWEDHRMVDRKELDAEDQTQTHQEEDYRSRMQL